MKLTLNHEQLSTGSKLLELVSNKYKPIGSTNYINIENSSNLPINKNIYYNLNTASKDLLISELLEQIENNPLLNYSETSHQNEINIILVNENNNDLFEHYDKNNNSIIITEKLLFNENIISENFTEILFDYIGPNKLLIFAICHEIGHAIQNQIYYKNNQNYLSFTKTSKIDLLNPILNNGAYIYGKDYNSLPYDVNHAIYQAITEGFADLYACIAISQIYSKEVAVNVISEIIKARNESEDYYYSSKTMQTFLDDFKNDKVHFISFNEVSLYMENTLIHTTQNVINNKLSSNNETQIKYNNAFLGGLTSIFSQKYYSNPRIAKCNSGKEVVEALDIINHNFSNSIEDFEYGKKITMDSLDNRIISKKQSLFKLKKIRASSLLNHKIII